MPEHTCNDITPTRIEDCPACKVETGGAAILDAIAATTPLVDPRLSEIDWSAVAEHLYPRDWRD